MMTTQQLVEFDATQILGRLYIAYTNPSEKAHQVEIIANYLHDAVRSDRIPNLPAKMLGVYRAIGDAIREDLPTNKALPVILTGAA